MLLHNSIYGSYGGFLKLQQRPRFFSALCCLFCPGDASGEEDALGSGSDDEDGGGELTEVSVHHELVALRG